MGGKGCMPSINVDLNFFSHRKTIRLSAQLGDQAIACLLRLWCYAGQHDPEYGSLGDMLDYEIEHIANWRGEQGQFVRSLISIGFLDMVDGKAKIHDWEDHARHLIIYRERAKKGANAKWDRYKIIDASSNASSMLQADQLVEKSTAYASSIASSNAKDAISTVPIQYNTIQGNTVHKEKNISSHVSKKPSKSLVLDAEWITGLKTDPVYAGIDIDLQFRKASAWYPAHGRKLSRKAFINWLIREMGNKPIETKQTSYEGSYHKKVQL